MQKKSKLTTILLALLLGGLGIHKFYLGQPRKGILYILFCITNISGLLALIDAIKFIIWDEEKFDEYVNSNVEVKITNS